MNILKVKDLCKTYIVNKRQNNVLKNVNFSVEEGEMVAIMGPSGSGKSTLLYAVSGMDGITSGEAEFCGRDIAKLREKELADLRLAEMGFIFQQMYMLKNLTVLDNIILPAVQSKKSTESRQEIAKRGQELMRKLGIIEITPFGEAPRTIQLERSAGGHNGADEGFVQNFMESYLHGTEFDSSISESIELNIIHCLGHEEESAKYKTHTSGISKNSTKTIYLASYGFPAPLQIGSCGGESASVSEPTF